MFPDYIDEYVGADVLSAAYKDILSRGKLVEMKQRVANLTDSSVMKLSPEEMRAKAMGGVFRQGCGT